jgi:hypothetical protein
MIECICPDSNKALLVCMYVCSAMQERRQGVACVPKMLSLQLRKSLATTKQAMMIMRSSMRMRQRHLLRSSSYSSLADVSRNPSSPTECVLALKRNIDMDRYHDAWQSFQDLVKLHISASTSTSVDSDRAVTASSQSLHAATSPASSQESISAIPSASEAQLPPLDTQDLGALMDALTAGKIAIPPDQRRFALEQILAMCNTRSMIGYEAAADNTTHRDDSFMLKGLSQASYVPYILFLI